MSARRRRQGVLVSPLVPPLAGFAGWLDLHQPLHAAGAVALISVGLAVSVVLPALVISARGLPLILIPVRVRKWWRDGRDGRPHIPDYLRRAVYAADRHRCAWCKAPWAGPCSLQLDHYRPWSAGGLTVLWNMVTLCGRCNRVKSNYWVYPSGFVSYVAWQGHDSRAEAARILAFERWHRWNPARWVRAGFSLAA